MKTLRAAAAVAALSVSGALAHQTHRHAEAAPPKLPMEVAEVLARYRAAFEARSTDRLSEVVDPALLVLEGTTKNVGWADYRDNHIGPEMKGWESLSYSDVAIVDSEVAGDAAWAVVQETVTMVSGGKTAVVDAAETFVLRRRDGVWKIRHIHWSGRRRPEAKAAEAK